MVHSFAKASSHIATLLQPWIEPSLDFFTYVPFFMAHSFAKASSHIATLLQPWIEPSLDFFT